MYLARRCLMLLVALVWGCGGAPEARPVERPPPEPTQGAEETIVMAFSAEMDADAVPDPEDSDGDGFSDDIDLCPTLSALTEDGCPKHVRVSEDGSNLELDPGIEFQRRTATFKGASETALEELRTVLEGSKELRVRIEAHTFDRRSPTINMELSIDRATAVRDWLTSRAVEPTRLEVYGCGKERPRVSTKGRRRFDNRRVEVRIIEPLPPTGYPSTVRCREVKTPAASPDVAAWPSQAPALQMASAPADTTPTPTPVVVSTRAPATAAAPAPAPSPTAKPAAKPVPTPAPVVVSVPTPVPAPVAAPPSGDQDGDGIRDASDRCPRTPGLRSLRGCAKRHRLELGAGRIALMRRLHFVDRGTELVPRAATLLEEVAATLVANPSVHVRLEVRDGDRQLAAARAASARKWLAEHGIDAARVTAAGCAKDAGRVTISASEGAAGLGALPADCIPAAD